MDQALHSCSPGRLKYHSGTLDSHLAPADSTVHHVADSRHGRPNTGSGGDVAQRDVNRKTTDARRTRPAAHPAYNGSATHSVQHFDGPAANEASRPRDKDLSLFSHGAAW